MLMGVHMFPHCGAVGKSFVAKVTNVGLLAGVDPQVFDQVGPLEL